MNHSLNLKETQTDSLLMEFEVDQNHSDNLLVKIDDFTKNIDTISNLLRVELKMIHLKNLIKS